MLGFVSFIFIVIVSSAFAFLYVLRIHIDYCIHVLVAEDTHRDPPVKYIVQLLAFGLFAWLMHALALATSRETNQQIIQFLINSTDWLMQRLHDFFTISNIVLLILLIAVQILIAFIRGNKIKGRFSLKPLYNKIIGLIGDAGLVIGILILLFLLLAVFSSINKYVVLNLPDNTAEIIGDMLLAFGVTFIMVMAFIVFIPRLFLRKKLSSLPPVSKEEMPHVRIWKEVYGTHIKDAVWYGMIYIFVPCLLFRWSHFIRQSSIGDHAVYILGLAIFHIVGGAAGGILDWMEIQKLRTYDYRRQQYPFDWQVDANMWFTRIKDMVILIPITIISWVYFFWNIMRHLS